MAKKIVGIYQITCVKNGKRYVGQSKDIRCRFNQHKCKPPARMVEDFEQYGKGAFKFEILEECAPEELDRKETAYINELHPEYNIRTEGQGMSDEGREKLRKLNTGKKHPETSKKVKCVETGEIFSSQKAAAEAYNTTTSSISNVLHGKQVTVAGFRFEYVDGSPSETRENRLLKPVRCIETGNIFPTVKEAAKSVGINSRTISAALHGQSFTAAGCHWEFADGRPANIRPEETRKPRRKPVRCIETGMVYESIRAAANSIGVCSTTIGHAVNGRYEKVSGCHWEFVDKRSHKPYKGNPQQKRGKVVRCVETNNIFKTISEAAIHVGICVSLISQALHGKIKTAGGYHWELVKENPAPIPVKKLPKTTAKIVRCVETQKIFNSVREAAESLGIHSSAIGHALQGKTKTAGSYHWEYLTA